jgi:dihydropyrimidinase
MTYDVVIRGGRIVEAWGELTTDLAITGERIAAVGDGLRGRREIAADGLLVLPGAVDGHVHMRTERDTDVYDDTWETGSIAGAFGGVTAFVDQAQVEPGTPLPAGLDRRLAEAEGCSVIDYGLHVNLRDPDPARIAEIPTVMARGCPSIKLFMSYPTYELPDDAIFGAMQHVAAGGGLAVVHAENGRVVAALGRALERDGEIDPAAFPAVSPPVMEGEAVHRALAIARLAGARVLIFHVTSREGIAELWRARSAGQPAHGEALLHHLLLDESLHADPDVGTAFMGTPPLRGADDRAALWDALRLGTLDVVSTDHGPRRRVADERGVLRIPPGTSGIEVRLALMHSEGVLAGRLSRPRWVELCCTNPALIHGLPAKGRLAPGYDADVVLFDPADVWTVTPSHLHSAIDHATYDGMTVRGRPVTTISRGDVIVDDGELRARPGRGRFLRRRYPASPVEGDTPPVHLPAPRA